MSERNRWRRRLYGLPLLLVLLGVAAPATPEIADDVLRPSLLGSKTFSESYTLIADLEQDVYVQLQLAVTNFGIANGRGGCRLLLVDGEQAPLRKEIGVGRKGWGYSDKGPPTLRVGSCRIVGGERTEFHVDLDGMQGVLRLDASIRPVRPLERRMQLGSSSYESDILIPWAAAELSLQQEGDELRILRGFGYGDHSRSTTLPSSLASRWVRFRGLADAGSVLILVRDPADEGGADGWVWAQGEPRPEPLLDVRIQRPGQRGGALRVEARAATGDVYSIEMEREIDRFAPLERSGLRARLLRGIVGNPVTYTYRAVSVREGAEGEAVRGIAEVTIVDES